LLNREDGGVEASVDGGPDELAISSCVVDFADHGGALPFRCGTGRMPAEEPSEFWTAQEMASQLVLDDDSVRCRGTLTLVNP